MNDILYVSEPAEELDAGFHSHPHWEVLYCAGGEGAYQVDNGPALPYRAGQAVAIPPETVHRDETRGATGVRLAMETPAFPFKTPFRVDDDPDGRMGAAFTQAEHYYRTELKGRELILGALGELIGSYMLVFRDNREFSSVVEHIRSSILHNFSSPAFELDQVIRQMPFNYDYLRKLFQKEMGLTPLKYMIDLRMKKAKGMLAAAWTREYSVAEVAENCGFSDALYFSRVFKKYYGCSPSEFVKRRREGG